MILIEFVLISWNMQIGSMERRFKNRGEPAQEIFHSVGERGRDGNPTGRIVS